MIEATSSSSTGTVKRYKTAYRKQPGTLIVTQTTLSWTPDVAGSETVAMQQLGRIISE